MNWISFLDLIISIYGKKMPDIDKIRRKGLLAVKIGQVHALRIDFLNEEKCRHLAKLYRNNKRISNDEVEKLIEINTDSDFRGNFDSIDKNSIASASIGQIHWAKLKSGKEVIIKLVKENFRNNFISDVRSIKNLFQFIIRFYPKLQKVADPIGILNDIEEYTLSELNLLNEMKGQKILKEVYEKNKEKYDLSKLGFTHIYPEFTNENVLVADFIEGKTFDELLETGELNYSEILSLFHIHGFYMFGAGIFHGDIHPGNIIKNGDKLYFVDTGYIGYVGDKIRKGLFNFFDALSRYDYIKCAYYLNKMADKEITGKDYDVYQKKFVELYSDFTNASVSKVSLTKKMMHTIKLGVNSGMVFEKGIFAIIRSLMYMDGMVLKCKPDAVLIKDMRSFLECSRSFLD